MKATMPKIPNKVAAPNKEQDLTQKVMQGESPRSPAISNLDLVATKTSTKTAIPFNIFEQMKRASLNVSMWDAISIPSQRDLLQEVIKEMDVTEDTIQGCSSSISTSLVKPLEAENPKKISKPPSFYLSLIIGDKIVHNCMIDSMASSSVVLRE